MAKYHTGRRDSVAMLAVTSVLAAGCAHLAPTTNPGRPTGAMEAMGATRTAVDIRQRVDALVPPLVAFVEQTADRVRAGTSDETIRRQALRLKIDLVPVIYEAGFQADPLVAALDLWLLSYQMQDCLEAGTGPCDFGSEQEIVRAAARQQREAFDQLFQVTALDPETLSRCRDLVQRTARRYPLQAEGSIRRRRTMTTELAKTIDIQPVRAFDVVGDMSVTLTSLTTRLNLYLDDVPRLARWHAELLAEDAGNFPAVHHALEDVDRLTISIDGLTKALAPESLNALIDRPLAALETERQRALDDIDRQRVLMQKFAAGQREATTSALMSAVRDERIATITALQKEHAATVEEVERLRRDLVADAYGRGTQLIDHLVWRLAELLGGLLLLAAILAWAVTRQARAGRSHA